MFVSQVATQYQKLIVPHPLAIIGMLGWIYVAINVNVTMATDCQALIGYFWPSESN